MRRLKIRPFHSKTNLARRPVLHVTSDRMAASQLKSKWKDSKREADCYTSHHPRTHSGFLSLCPAAGKVPNQKNDFQEWHLNWLVRVMYNDNRNLAHPTLTNTATPVACNYRYIYLTSPTIHCVPYPMQEKKRIISA